MLCELPVEHFRAGFCGESCFDIGFRPSSQKNAMHPPPPAPQTFGAIAPFARALSISMSICGVVMFGERRFRCGCASRRISPTASQSFCSKRFAHRERRVADAFEDLEQLADRRRCDVL